MVIQPIYNILFLPDVTYHFKKEFFTENASEQLEVGSELLFAFLRMKMTLKNWTLTISVRSAFPPE